MEKGENKEERGRWAGKEQGGKRRIGRKGARRKEEGGEKRNKEERGGWGEKEQAEKRMSRWRGLRTKRKEKQE